MGATTRRKASLYSACSNPRSLEDLLLSLHGRITQEVEEGCGQVMKTKASWVADPRINRKATDFITKILRIIASLNMNFVLFNLELQLGELEHHIRNS
ncbi:hypothetical protein Pint_21858 [Pistacia integerrima]|uniref:Uncharacterized protein n=1 Tax=Pistacia integerrima TaxID=434235 RepID=A0ACC0X9T2_9ROSI|nr:hypothetical protein Pint_21858 [Pistacia integerrima]